MYSIIIAEAAACTVVAGVTAQDYRSNKRLPYAIAATFAVALFLAYRESLSFEQLLAIPCLCAITYTDTTFRSISIALLITLITFSVFVGVQGGLLWLAIALAITIVIRIAEPLTPPGDLLTVTTVIALFHALGLIATGVAIALCLLGTLRRGSTLLRIERIARTKWPLAGIVTATVLLANAVVAVAIPAPFASPDALRLLGMP
jgi:hypothetical protein